MKIVIYNGIKAANSYILGKTVIANMSLVLFVKKDLKNDINSDHEFIRIVLWMLEHQNMYNNRK